MQWNVTVLSYVLRTNKCVELHNPHTSEDKERPYHPRLSHHTYFYLIAGFTQSPDTPIFSKAFILIMEFTLNHHLKLSIRYHNKSKIFSH